MLMNKENVEQLALAIHHVGPIEAVRIIGLENPSPQGWSEFTLSLIIHDFSKAISKKPAFRYDDFGRLVPVEQFEELFLAE